MGRALIIIIAITVGVLGLMQINLNSNQLVRVTRSADYSTDLQARNVAHGAIEVTLAELASNPDWRNGYEPYEVSLDYGTAYVTIHDQSKDTSLTPMQLRLISRVPSGAGTVMVAVLAERFVPKMPQIKGAVNFMDDNFTADLFGSFLIDGNDRASSGENLAGVALKEDSQLSDFTSDNIKGLPEVGVYPEMDYNTMEMLIRQIRSISTPLEGVINNSYGNLGSPESPGVFRVEDYAEINGNIEGWGILLVENDAQLEIASEMSVGGTFEFNGLVLFKNTWEFKGRGDVTVNGTVVVGSPDAVPPTDVSIGGNLSIFYDTQGIGYAEKSAFSNVPPTYSIVRYYE